MSTEIMTHHIGSYLIQSNLLSLQGGDSVLITSLQVTLKTFHFVL